MRKNVHTMAVLLSISMIFLILAGCGKKDPQTQMKMGDIDRTKIIEKLQEQGWVCQEWEYQNTNNIDYNDYEISSNAFREVGRASFYKESGRSWRWLELQFIVCESNEDIDYLYSLALADSFDEDIFYSHESGKNWEKIMGQIDDDDIGCVEVINNILLYFSLEEGTYDELESIVAACGY